MATNFILIKWKSEGLRCPDHEIAFADVNGNPSSMTLIQMPNGTGKTTTLKLLRAALSGEATGWSPDVVRSLRKKGNSTTAGQFMIECLCDQKRLTIVIDLNFEEGLASYSTTFGNGKQIGFHPPHILRRFLNEDFVRLFVFDGEQAEHLLDHHRTNANDAIDSLFQLKFFDKMQGWVTEYFDEHVNMAGAGDKPSDKRGLSRRKNRVEELKQRLIKCKSEHKKECLNRDKLKDQVERKTCQFKDSIKAREEYSGRLRAAEKTLDDAKTVMQAKTNEVYAKLRDPYALSPGIAFQISELRANLDRVKLPESTAREFFEELAQESECVCGRLLNDTCRTHIREQASRYLGSDDVSLLNAMKSDISDRLGAKPEDHSAQLDTLLIELRSAIRNESETRTAKDIIENEAIAKDPKLEHINEEITALRLQLEESERILEKYEDRNDTLGDEHTFGIIALERRLKDAEKKLAEITQTVELKKKRDILNEILRDAHERARKSIGEATVKQANERISTLMPTNAIRIREIKNCLILEGQEGGSMGETLSVAYAFLATFFNSANHSFPFIVDSPAGSIDLAIRPRIAELASMLTTQFVAFTISSERQGFSEHLQKKFMNKTNFITLFRKNNQLIERSAKEVQGCIESSDGLLVPGHTFFNNFQMESEVE